MFWEASNVSLDTQRKTSIKEKWVRNTQAEIRSTKYHIHKNNFNPSNEKNVLNYSCQLG